MRARVYVCACVCVRVSTLLVWVFYYWDGMVWVANKRSSGRTHSSQSEPPSHQYLSMDEYDDSPMYLQCAHETVLRTVQVHPLYSPRRVHA